jgi:hypothetical protein
VAGERVATALSHSFVVPPAGFGFIAVCGCAWSKLSRAEGVITRPLHRGR